MGRGDGGAERAGRNITNFFNDINSAGWTGWNFAIFVELDVRRQVAGIVDGFAVCLAVFQSKLIRSGINLTEIVDASIGRAAASIWNEIWYGNPN